jgi:single-strand DNA-binding protein
MYNRVVLVGNLTRDVEIRHTPGGTTIGKVGIATSRKYKSNNGEQKEEVMFIDLTLFGRTAEIAQQYLKKGSQVLVEGRLVLEQWTAQDGTKRSKHSVTVDHLQMLGGRQSGANAADRNFAPQNSGAGSQQPPRATSAPRAGEASTSSPAIPEINVDDESTEIPF